MNLIGFMMGKMLWHSDSFMELMLSKMLRNLDPEEENHYKYLLFDIEKEKEEEDTENLLVFKDN